MCTIELYLFWLVGWEFACLGLVWFGSIRILGGEFGSHLPRTSWKKIFLLQLTFLVGKSCSQINNSCFPAFDTNWMNESLGLRPFFDAPVKMERISVADPERNKKLAMFHKSARLFDKTPRIQDSATPFLSLFGTLTDLQMPFSRMTHLPKWNSHLPTPRNLPTPDGNLSCLALRIDTFTFW